MITDDFTGTNGTMAAAWVANTAEADPTGFFRDGSGHAQPASDNWNSDLSMQYSTGALGDNQWAEATLNAPATGGMGAGMGACVRMASTSVKTYYRVVGNGSGWELGRLLAGVFASLGSGSSPTFAAGDTIYLEANGTTITAKKGTASGVGGTVLGSPVTDGNIASGQPGLAYSSADTNAKIDLFNADTLSSSATNATATVPGVGAAAAVGALIIRPAPPPPFVLTTVTG